MVSFSDRAPANASRPCSTLLAATSALASELAVKSTVPSSRMPVSTTLSMFLPTSRNVVDNVLSCW